MTELPSGTVTFLFTDLEGSTRLWEEHSDSMLGPLTRHDEIVQSAIAAHGGQLVKSTGDGFHAVFVDAARAVEAAVEAQRALGNEAWGVPGELRVRMGINTGAAEFRSGDYPGTTVNRAARVANVANGGQVVVTETTADLIRNDHSTDVGLLDLGEHSLRDLTRPGHLFQVTAPGIRSDFPPLRSLTAFPGNLPLQLSTFVGREVDLERVSDALKESRIVTLTGTSGVGKTRLAVHAAAEALLSHQDGAWLCELADVRDDDAVVRTVAAVFGVRPEAGRELVDALVDAVGFRDLVIVLDNCEHLLEPVAELAESLMRAGEGIRIIATSRQALGADGEHVVVVDPFDVPEPGATLADIERSTAVRLFVDRAHAARDDFELVDDNAAAIAEVCRELDGIALAIELAASRVVTFAPAELARLLNHRLAVLTSRRRAAGGRHQTLRAAIDWSYELLNEPERQLMAQLGVFAGGFTLDAAEAVTGGNGVLPEEIWDQLDGLVRQSLVAVNADPTQARYQLLQPIREYALELLEADASGRRIHDAHASYYATFMATAVRFLASPEELEWTRRVDRELDNARAALNWAVEESAVDIALQFLALCSEPVFSWTTNYLQMVQSQADAAIALNGASTHPRFPAALAGAAWLAYERGDLDRAQVLSDDALRAEQRLGTRPPLFYPWVVQANIGTAKGHLAEYVENFERAVAIMRVRGERTLPAPLAFKATMLAVTGETARALVDAQEALELARRVGAPTLLAIALASFGMVMSHDDPQRAMALMREAADVQASTGHPGHGRALIIAATLAARHGTRAEALALYARTFSQASHAGVRYGLNAVANLLAVDAPEDAAVLLGAADALSPDWAEVWAHSDERRSALADLDAALGSSRLAELRDRGASMDSPAAVEYARKTIERWTAQNDAPNHETGR